MVINAFEIKYNSSNSCTIWKDINKSKIRPKNQFLYELLAVNRHMKLIDGDN